MYSQFSAKNEIYLFHCFSQSSTNLHKDVDAMAFQGRVPSNPVGWRCLVSPSSETSWRTVTSILLKLPRVPSVNCVGGSVPWEKFRSTTMNWCMLTNRLTSVGETPKRALLVPAGGSAVWNELERTVVICYAVEEDTTQSLRELWKDVIVNLCGVAT